MSYTPDAETVLKTWLASLFSGRADVATDIPANSWGSLNLLVTLATVTPNHDAGNPRRMASVQLDVWGRNSTQTGRAPINMTSALAEDIHDAALYPGRLVVAGPTASFRNVRVTSIESTGFVRVPDEEQATIAHFRGTLTVVFVPIEI